MRQDLEKPIRFGVYLHKKNATFAYAYPPSEDDKQSEWCIDRNEYKQHPIFRAKIPVVRHGTGKFFFNSTLKNYELIDENL